MPVDQLPVRSLSDLIAPEAFAAHQEAVDALDEKVRSFQDASLIDPDTASVDELRYLVKHVLKAQKEQARLAAQPLGVDIYSHLPIHFDPPECPVCLPFAQRNDDHNPPRARPVCHDCDQIIPYLREDGGRGSESVSVTHLHLHAVMGGNGAQIRCPARRELCRPCYVKDFEKEKGIPWPGW